MLWGIIAGIVSSVAVAAFAIASQPRRPPLGAGAPPPPPPPPDTTGLTISVGLCVLAWAAVLIALARDRVLQRLTTIQLHLAALEEYGERRETDGYLRAVRAAGLPATGEVRPLHRVPPPTQSPE